MSYPIFVMVNNKTSVSGEEVDSKPSDPDEVQKATITFTVKVKPRSVMGDYIALHGLVPQNELPVNLRHKIPENEIWIRQDVYDDPERRELILQGHEKFELELMETEGLKYKQAHDGAEFHERFFRIDEELEKEKVLKMKSVGSVRVVEPAGLKLKNQNVISKANHKKER